MKNLMMRLWKEEEGQDLIEYVLLVALLALLVAAAFPEFAAALTGQLKEATNCMNKLSKGACK
jgi:Flp pilus assembly pilin Flp